MIDLTRVRNSIAQDLAPLHVYRRAITDALVLPCAVIGAPDIEWRTGPCMDTVTLPVAVVVARDGVDDAATQAELEELMLETASLLHASADHGELAALCAVATITRADFEQLGVQGRDYPAYTFELKLHG